MTHNRKAGMDALGPWLSNQVHRAVMALDSVGEEVLLCGCKDCRPVKAAGMWEQWFGFREFAGCLSKTANFIHSAYPVIP